jgi:ATP-dependent helicase Lhr and Lhr-like helicase
VLRARRASPPAGSGRFSLLATRLSVAPAASATERLAAQVEQLLARFGLLSRDAVLAEELPGGFSAIYPVLRAMEEAGRVRRGYFVTGLGAAQFADPGALERLRSLKEPAADDARPEALLLAACDPANPYGAVLPWPRREARLARAAGAHVVLLEGTLVAYSSAAERELVTFLPEDEPARSRSAQALAAALWRWLERSLRLALPYESVDGVPLQQSALAPFLRAAGFVPYGLGFRLAAPAPAPAPKSFS